MDLNLSGICGVATDMKGRIVREWLRLFARNDYDCVMETLDLGDTEGLEESAVPTEEE